MKIKPSHARAAIVLSAIVLGAPVLTLHWELRSPLGPVFWTLGIMALYLTAIRPWQTAWHWTYRLLASLFLLGAGGLLLLLIMLTMLFRATGLSLPLADGCRVEAEMVGGFGDTDLHVRHQCPVMVLWERSSPLLSDTEAVVTQFRALPPATDGTAQVAVTLSRYGKPDELRTLRIPSR